MIIAVVIIIIFSCDAALSEGVCKIDEVRSEEETLVDVDYYGSRHYQTVYKLLYHYGVCERYESETSRLIVSDSDPPTLEYLTFSDSIIKTIPTNFFTSFNSIKKLYMKALSINNILPGAFNGIFTLKELDLSNNAIRSILPGVFNSLSQLELLNISNNNVDVIEEHSFTGLTQLKKIDLHNNTIAKISSGVFQSLSSIRNMDLSHNYLTNISDLCLDNMSLISLNLTFNEIISIEFSKLPKTLQILDLNNNLLTHVIGFSDLNRLVNLNLSYNAIRTIESFENDDKRALEVFDISHNNLTNLSVKAFKNCFKLSTLLIQNNLLNKIQVDCFRDLNALRELNLSKNKLTNIHHGTFSNLHKLETLDVSYNQLLVIEENIFYGLRELKVLNIANNSIENIDPDDILSYCTNLSEVTLSNNRWNCKVLSKILQVFNKHKVLVTKDTSENVLHIGGTACYVENTSKSVPSSESKASTDNDYLEAFVTKLNLTLAGFYRELLQLENARITKAFSAERFDENFKNSSFYKFFNEDFKKSEFFDYMANLNFALPVNTKNQLPLLSDVSRWEEHEKKENNFKDLLNAVNTFKNQVLIFLPITFSIFLCVCVITYYCYFKSLIAKMNKVRKGREENVELV